MFEFLKDMFGVPRPVKVVAFEDPEIVLESDSPLDLGLVGVLAEIEGVKIKAQIQVVEVGLECSRAFWIAPQEVLPLLIEVFTPCEKRRAHRFPRKLRVRSTKLENFQGNTLDLSQTGMRLEGRGNFTPGELITITFELDDIQETKITTLVEISWVGPAERKGWIAMGLHYKNLNMMEQTKMFSLYCSFLESLH